jgi:FkbM family methyltransferase
MDSFYTYLKSRGLVSDKTPEQDLITYLNFLKSQGLKIDVVYDIGAWMGYWSPLIKQTVLPDAKFIMFEANDKYIPSLSASGFPFFNVVLSNPGREYVDFYNGTNSGDSYYKETTKIYDNQTSIKLPCTTLDNIIQTYQLPYPNFIKIDTQGSELDILQGATSVLKFVDLIYVECPILTYNKGAPDIRDYLNFFKNHEFLPVQLVEQHVSEDMLIQVDIMFMKKHTKDRILQPNNINRPWG